MINVFDGDEMNIFAPQSLQTQIELAEIADVKRQIITPRLSTPIIGIVQDGLLGAYNLTAPTMSINWKDAMNIVSYTTVDNFDDFKKDKDYKGSDLFSLIIPGRINTNKAGLKVKNGKIVEGQVKKDHLGSKKSNSLIHLIWDEYGIEETKNFIDNTQRLVNNFNMFNGFTVGIGDINIPKDLEKQMNILFETKKLEIKHLITEMENNPDLYDSETFEQNVYRELNNVRETVSTMIMKNLKPENNFNIMISSGSKGGGVNMAQMGGCVGQQAVNGVRIEKKVNGRTLPYFFQNDDSAEARGFVEQPFINGMTPQSFIFHNMGSREGLIDTAIKTAQSGYIQRKLIKSMEDAMIKYDLTVRNANNTIIQFTYGDNGIDTTKQSYYTSKILLMGNKEISEKYRFTSQELKNYPKFTSKQNDEYYYNLLRMRDELRYSTRRSSLDYIRMNNRFVLPVNMARIINNVKGSKISSTKKLEPDYIIDKIDDILDHNSTILFALSQSDSNNRKSFKYRDEMTSKIVFKFALHEYLAPKVTIFGLGLNRAQFDEICKQIIDSFNRSVIEPGEMVGTIAAQSLGEPVTQLTLNTFHFAGIGGMGTTTLGVPRMNELLSFSKNMKTPVMMVYLNKDIRANRDMADKIASYIKYTTIADIRKRVDVYYDPNPYKKGGFMDRDNVYNAFYKHNPGKNSCQSDISRLPWLMRIQIDKEKMMDKEITLLDIKAKFCYNWEKRYTAIKGIRKEEKQLLEKITQCAILSNNDNDIVPTIHIRFDMKDFDFNTIVGFLEVFVEDFKLKGIKGVEKINSVNPERILDYDNKNQEMKEESQNVVYTAGINLEKLRYINGIDINKTICNDVVIIYELYGIEATRSILLHEVNNIFEKAGNSVNYQHVSILIDIMTNSGILTSIDRHGLNKLDLDPLARASFEKTVDQLIGAAVFGQVDNMNSVSSRIMAGLAIKGGTGLCNIILDTDTLEKSEYVEDLEQKYEKTFTELDTNVIMDDIIGKETTGIFIPE